ncbi:hypothetical protein [Pseudomonas sp. Fl4BN1]|uniref:hypothetical protein n=1 Tax=Pseudomonas sp. Fl4BN1 TaxID=2697651 RepID=UPI0021147E32|nr:hypothetical protein [Pseudomonas sp. Fl4BN1]
MATLIYVSKESLQGNLSGSGKWQFDNRPDNRILAFKELRFSYDTRGNLSEKNSAAGGMQRFHYDSGTV